MGFLCITTLLVSGCASVPMASLAQDSTAKSFTPQVGKASLYIYRDEILGSAIPMTVIVNGKNIGQTASKTYFRLDLLPGEYSIDSLSENTSSLTLVMKEHNNYFVWQEVKMGMWMARSLLQQVDEKTGRPGVIESKLIKTQVADKEILPLGSTPPDATFNKLRQLNQLRQDGVITEEEFKQQKGKLLDSL